MYLDVPRSASELTDKISKTSVPRIHLKAWLATASCTWISYVWARCYHFTDSSVSNIGLRSVVSNAALSLSTRFLRFSQLRFVTMQSWRVAIRTPKRAVLKWYGKMFIMNRYPCYPCSLIICRYVYISGKHNMRLLNLKSRLIQAPDRWKHLELSMPLGLGMLVLYPCSPSHSPSHFVNTSYSADTSLFSWD